MKIHPRDFEAFRAKLPAELRSLTFRYVSIWYDVTKALFLVEKLALKPIQAKVKEFAASLELDGPLGAMPLLQAFEDKDVLKERIDPSIPVIFLERQWTVGEKTTSSALMLDGHKRLRKAFLEDRETFKFYWLPARYEPLLRIEEDLSSVGHNASGHNWRNSRDTSDVA